MKMAIYPLKVQTHFVNRLKANFKNLIDLKKNIVKFVKMGLRNHTLVLSYPKGIHEKKTKVKD